MGKDDGNPNTVGDRYNQVGASASLDEIYARTRRMSEVNTVAGERLRQEGRAVRQNLRNLREANSLMSMPGIVRTPEIAAGLSQNRDEYAAALEQRSAVAANFYQESQIAKHRAGQAFQSQINQFTGSRQQATRINEAYSSSMSLDMASRQMNSTGFGGFEQMQQAGARAAREAAANLRDAAVNGAPEARIRELGGQLTGAESQIAVGRRGMQIARQLGQDPQSQFMHINNVSARAEERLGAERLGSIAGAGGLPSLKELNNQIEAAAKELGALKDEFASGKKPLEDFNKEAGAVADKLTKLEQQEKAVKGASGGGNQFTDMREAMGVTRAGLDTLRQTTINQPIQALNIKGQMAAAQNEQYATVKAALGGDMSALGLIGSGVFQNAAGFARQQQLTQKIIQTGDVAATGADALIDAQMLGTEGFSLGNIGGKTITGGERAVMRLARGGFDATTQASDIAQGITAGETSVSSYQAAINAQKAVLAVPSQFRQSFFDFGMSTTVAGRGMGGRREAMTRQMMNMGPGGFMQNMADMGVDPNAAAGFVGQGVSDQGSAFSIKQIGTARNLERAGFGTMEESMRRMSTLANTGGANDPNATMGRVMEEAVSKGMDSSKAVSLMTDGISHLAQTGGTAALGVDATQGITALLGRALGAPDGRSDINRAAAATGAINGVNNILQDNSVNYSNMVANTRMRQMGMSGKEAAIAGTLSVQELAELKQGGVGAERIANEKGLNVLFDKSGKFSKEQANKLAGIEGQRLEMAGGFAMLDSQATADGIARARAKHAKGESLNPQEAALLRTGNQNLQLGGVKQAIEGGDIAQYLKGVGAAPNGVASGKAADILGGKFAAGPESAAGENIKAQQAIQQAKELKAGSKDMESLSQVSKVLGSIAKAITPETMEKFAGAAGKAADDMKISAEGFEKVNKTLGPLATGFDTLKAHLEGLNTSIVNLGGFKTGGNAAAIKPKTQSNTNMTRFDRHGSKL